MIAAIALAILPSVAKGVPTQRAFLRWFHAVEDDPTRETALRAGYPLIEAAIADGLIDTQDVDGFAGVAIQLHDQGYLGSDHSRVEEWGIKPSHDLQQAQNLRSTDKGRSWLASGHVSISGSTIGNLAMRDINVSNVNVTNFFEAWEQKIEELDASPEDKNEAREKLRMAKDIITGAAGGAGGRLLYDAFPMLFG